MSASCSRPTGGPEAVETAAQAAPQQQKEKKMQVQIGKKAPDFTAPAYIDGKFSEVRLSDHFGKWIVLCFYPGDFTFV